MNKFILSNKRNIYVTCCIISISITRVRIIHYTV